ncbi:MAG: hypothetical protein GX638_12440, partial [Crenarchaeota archaeon]|nr:hypothetical protein [Thermoproteota archaeon]
MQERIVLIFFILVGMCVFLLVDNFSVFAQQKVVFWTEKSSMPTARYSAALAVVDGILFAIGGGIGSGFVVSNNEQYDPTVN